MGSYNYYPAGVTPDQKFGLTSFFPSVKPRLAILVGPGIGECNNGDLAGCKFSSGWGGWYWLKILADLFGIILVFLNTSRTSMYSLKEYQFALDWTLKKYQAQGITEANTWVLGHSLGSYGAGRYSFIDELAAFAKRVAGWIVSASGPYNSGWTAEKLALLMKILVEAGCKVWGVTAANDTVSGTNPKYVRQLYDMMKAIDPNAHVIVSEFPSTEWPNDYPVDNPTGSKAAHNNVLGRITQKPIGVRPNITRGIPEGLPFKMNIAEWMISNPRGSIYQPPTDAFVGPKFAAETPPVQEPVPPTPTEPAPVYIKAINWALDKKFCAVGWQDGTPDSILRSVLSDGRVVKNVYDRIVNGHYVLTITFTDNSPAHTIDQKSKWIQ